MSTPAKLEIECLKTEIAQLTERLDQLRKTKADLETELEGLQLGTALNPVGTAGSRSVSGASSKMSI